MSPGHYFQKPFYFLFNLAVGGTYTNIYDPAKITALPNEGDTAEMLVDWVRVYQADDDQNAPTCSLLPMVVPRLSRTTCLSSRTAAVRATNCRLTTYASGASTRQIRALFELRMMKWALTMQRHTLKETMPSTTCRAAR